MWRHNIPLPQGYLGCKVGSADEDRSDVMKKLSSSSVVFDRMLDQNMQEARTGEVDITDVDPDTLKLMLEFIYTEQVVIHQFFEIPPKKFTKVEDENYTAELLYAADKYDLGELVNISTCCCRIQSIRGCELRSNDQVKLCARHFRAEVTPDNAADILLLADRHCLAQLKQVGTKRV